MDTKKRPNEDQPDSDNVQPTTATSRNAELPASDSMNPAEPMAVDATAAHAPDAMSGASSTSTATKAAEGGVAPSEANKRIKLTLESDQRGANYSPSLDVADPSKESKGLAEWVGQMDKVDAAKVAEPPSKEGAGLGVSDASSLNEHRDSDAAHGGEAPEVSRDHLLQKHTEEVTTAPTESGSNQDLVQALLEPQTGAGATNLSDSILAVASLSEPLKTTLETMDLDSQPPVEPQVPQEDRSTLTVNSQLSSTVPPQPSADSHHTLESKQDEQGEASSGHSVTDERFQSEKAGASFGKPEAIKLNDSAQLPEESKPRSTTNAMEVDIPPEPAQDSRSSFEQSSEAGPANAAAKVAIEDSSDDVAMTVSQPVTDVSEQQVNASTAGSNTPVHEAGMNSSLDHDKQQSATKDSTLGQEPTTNVATNMSSSQVSASDPASHTQASVQNLAPSQNDLPPPSALASSTAQNARQSRSTMSVSALLVNSEDDAQRGQEPPQHMSRGVFTQYDHSPRPNHPSTLPAPLPPVQEPPLTGPVASASSPLQQPLRSTAVLNSATCGHDPANAPTPRHGQGQGQGQGLSGFDRDSVDHHHPSGRNQDSMPTYGTARGSQAKEYPADEVMESGGVSGYAPQRHRLVSPAGIRPLQESVNSLGTSGPMNGKLPGMGSVASNAPTHGHDPHGHHAPLYRSDGSLSSSGGRSNAYAPTQHAGPTHSSVANGHSAPYAPSNHTALRTSGPTVTPPTSSQSLPSSAPVLESRHPRLIVKTDPSLKLDGLPEAFLGYYRYDPGTLLPAMQGKENSLLEVRVASSYLTYDNYKVKKREVWGTDIYTDDSDVVAKYDLAVTLRVMPKLLKYQGSIRNRIKSRTWNTGHDGVSLRIESIRKLGAGEALNRGRSQSKRRMKEYGQERLRVLSNIHDETTESVQNERAMRTATFEFTHQGDPCFKYSPELVMDRHDGLSRKWTSWRLKKEVLIVENDEERYEISLQHQAGTDARRFDQYRFAVISPRTSLSSWSKASYPLESSDITEVLYEDLDWQDFEWVDRGVVVQPTERRQGAKQDNAEPSSAMEGVKTTAHDPKDDIRMDSPVEGEGSKATERKATPGAISTDISRLTRADASLQESRQDGVFCVVSRLFWRPMTEKRPAKSSAPETPSLGSGANPAKEPQNQAALDAQDSTLSKAPSAAVNVPGNVPVSQQQVASARSTLHDQVPNRIGAETSPEITKTAITSTTAPVPSSASSPPSTPLSKRDSHAPATVPSAPTSMPASASIETTGKSASSETLQNLTGEAGEAKNQEVQGQSLAAFVQNTGAVEREEGELEEGEIASD
ncbi:hypothetical protein BGZ72_006295 [Mortierella alpina]|nr:hypothetical protein BGZ72_006295 [Mortierella alpina]